MTTSIKQQLVLGDLNFNGYLKILALVTTSIKQQFALCDLNFNFLSQ